MWEPRALWSGIGGMGMLWEPRARWDGRMGMAVGAQGTAEHSVLGWGVTKPFLQAGGESRAAPARLGRC